MAEVLMVAGVVAAFVAGLAALVALAAMLRGAVLSVLWGWFAVPVFGLPEIGVAQAIGLALLVALFTKDAAESKSDDDKAAAAVNIAGVFLRPLFALGIGWIVKGFMA